MKFLNIACGNIFINNKDWTNIDFTTNSPDIQKVDLLNGLPFKDNSFDVIYSSHFIEHIPKNHLNTFLSDCYRILKPNGVIRLITPDLEFLISEYSLHITNKDFIKSDFVIELLLDQTVRLVSGGNLALVINKIKNSEDEDIKNYVKKLLGPNIFSEVIISSESRFRQVIGRVQRDPKIVMNILSLIWIRLVIRLLPKAFRNTNVSLASIGEKHMWVYDFFTLNNALKEAGFCETIKCDFDKSMFDSSIFEELDLTESYPRKGCHQLFVESKK